MGNLDDLNLDDNFDGNSSGSSSGSIAESNGTSSARKHQVDCQAYSRRRLEERLEDSRVRKQTQDYDFDLD